MKYRGFGRTGIEVSEIGMGLEHLLVADERVEQHLYNGCPTSRYPAADGRYRVRNAGGQFLGLANVVNGVLKVEKLFVERN